MNGIMLIALLLPILLGGGYLLGRHMRERQLAARDLSPVTRQHLELYQGGQLSEPMVEGVKRRYREWLDQGEVERVESSLHAGTQFVVRIRALVEIGTEEACQILERQLRRKHSDDKLEQAWYWIDLANSLRNLNRDESLPRLLDCVSETDEFPLVHYFAAETVCFTGFGGHLRRIDRPQGRAALRLLHRALEGLRYGVPPQIIIEGRVGELIEQLWDNRPAEANPLLVRLFAEVRKQVRRAPLLAESFAAEPFEEEAFQLQMSRLAALEPMLEEYLRSAGPALARALPDSDEARQRDLLFALNDLRHDASSILVPLLQEGSFPHAEVAVCQLRWARKESVATFLRGWTGRILSQSQRGQRRIRVRTPARPTPPPEFPYRAVLFALRGFPSNETERFLLAAARDFDPAFRGTALGSLGWWEPYDRPEVLANLQGARFDPCPEVRHAARAALARLGERQALQWFRQALASDNRQHVVDAIQAIAAEGLTLLWPELDQVSEIDDEDLAAWAREALAQMQEEMEWERDRRS